MSKSSSKKKSKKGIWIFLCLVLFIVFLAGGAVLWYHSVLKPAGVSGEKVAFEIEDGDTTDEILSELEDDRLIRSKTAAKIYLKLNGDVSFYGGTYMIDQAMSTPEILAYLSNPDNAEQTWVAVTFPEGSWARDEAKILANALNTNAQDYLDLWNDADYIQTLSQTYSFIDPSVLDNDAYYVKLEGYLFPDTYHIEKDATPDQITRQILDQFQVVYNEYKDAIDQSQYSLEQLLTLASIVQFESGDAKYMPDIAEVFYNRLEQGMKLQSSVTVCYAMYDEYQSASDCETNPDVDSPYNTYENEGLPVGPIDNPGREAIEAVLYPADNNYLYFVSDIYGDGSIHFAETYEEHEANVDKYGLRYSS